MKVLKLKDGVIKEMNVSEQVYEHMHKHKDGGEYMDENYFNNVYKPTDMKKVKELKDPIKDNIKDPVAETLKQPDNDRRNNQTDQGNSNINTGSGNPSIDPRGETIKEVKRPRGNSKGQPNKGTGRGGAKKKA